MFELELIGTKDMELEPKKTVVVIPAFKEERYIGSVILRARKYVDMVIVVDDGSPDATAEVALAAGATVIKHDINKGYGAALATALLTARQVGADAAVLIDADGQHDPSQIPHLLEPILVGSADMVVGSRYLQKEGEVPQNRAIAHRVVTAMTNGGSGLQLSDSQCGYRAFSKRALDDMNIESQGMSAASEFQFLATECEWQVKEVPVIITYDERVKRNLIMHGLDVVYGIMQLVSRSRPLFFFGSVGATMVMAGIAIALYVVARYHQIQELPIGHALASLLTIEVGILTVFTGIILNSLKDDFSDLRKRLGNSRRSLG